MKTKVVVGQWRSYQGTVYQVVGLEKHGRTPVLTQWANMKSTLPFEVRSVEYDPVLTQIEVNDYLLTGDDK